MSHIHNEAAYEAAIKAKIKANACKTRFRKWLDKDERAQEVIDFIRGRNYDNPSSFLAQMEKSFDDWGALTEGQRNAVCKIIDQQAERKAEYDAQKLKSNHIGIVGERMQFNAEVLFRVWVEGAYGIIYIVGMRSGDNMIVFKGNGDLADAKKGDTVSFMAKVKDHGERDGQKQTIVQRPTKVEISEA